MNEPVCIVTGADRGLGKAIATGLARKKAMVVMLCRDRYRGEKAQKEIASVSGGAAELIICDLAYQKSIREAADEITKRYRRINVLINNAAVFKRTRTVSPDGYELMFATNHLGPFLLTNLLLGLLKKSAPSRIINISAPSRTRIDFDNIQGERKFSAYRAFTASKMCNLLSTFHLARHLEGTGISVKVIHPGLVRTDLMAEAPAPLRWFFRLISVPPEKAADPVIHYALSDEVKGITGKFFGRWRPINPDPYALDKEVQERLRMVSQLLTGLSARRAESRAA